MADFVCKVADTRGQVSVQVEQAASEAELRRRLSEKGLFIYSVRSRARPVVAWPWKPGRKRVTPGDFLLFNQQFITLIRAGLPIVQAIDLLARRAARPSLRKLLEDVRERIRGGASLSDAFAAQGVFSPVYVASLLAGERSGNLAGVLEYYVNYLKVTQSVRRRLLGAMVYPALLVVFSGLVLSFVIVYVVPRFSALYSDLGGTLPPLTLAVITFALSVRSSVVLLTAGLVTVVLGVFLASRTEAGAQLLDRARLKLPLAGTILRRFRLAQFSRTLSTLLAGGIPVVSSLEVAGDALESPVLRSAMQQATRGVREGQSLHAALASSGQVPEMVSEMVEVGESTGALPQMLNSVAEFYEEELDAQLGWVLSLVQPVLLLVVAGVIAVILVALYLPIFSVGTLVR